MCVSRDLRHEDDNPSIPWSKRSTVKFTRSFRPSIFIFVITLNDTHYWKRVHHYWLHDLSNYRSWVSASLNTNNFSKLTKDDLPKFSSCHNTGIKHLSKFPCQNFKITNSPKFFPTTILCYMVSWTKILVIEQCLTKFSFNFLTLSWTTVVVHMVIGIIQKIYNTL